ncbi:hypothetical protein TNIN_230631 [Trichonephila inaurata madagascariensis]|uniref:Uncharacterized protein n=1 Tax=Trichonephila inaurata madagascariensis TaxID=2747483 RepID=A0A8X6XWP5_9ARAC|nr:hypothetical protein TNIN_230631 [Trichonephila inaurata madagascariensis]
MYRGRAAQPRRIRGMDADDNVISLWKTEGLVRMVSVPQFGLSQLSIQKRRMEEIQEKIFLHLLEMKWHHAMSHCNKRPLRVGIDVTKLSLRISFESHW